MILLRRPLKGDGEPNVTPGEQLGNPLPEQQCWDVVLRRPKPRAGEHLTDS